MVKNIDLITISDYKMFVKCDEFLWIPQYANEILVTLCIEILYNLTLSEFLSTHSGEYMKRDEFLLIPQ